MKIVFCDLDGTILLSGENKLSKEVVAGINKILDNNIIFCVASGRCYSELRRIMGDLSQRIYFIPSDGSQIIYKEETLYEVPLDKSELGFLDEERDYVLHGKYLSYVKSCKDTFVRKIKEQYNGHIERVSDYKEIKGNIYKLSLYGSHREIPLDNVYKDYNIREFVNENLLRKDLKLKDNILIAGIIRDGKAIIPNGNDMILENDNVIIVTTNQFLDDLNEILA